MKKYQIKEVSKLMNVKKSRLRYYDELNILSPKRLDNDYRYYSDKDIYQLKMIEVMKYVGFNLDEIKQIMNNQQFPDENRQCLEDTIKILDEKKKSIEKHIEILNESLQIFDNFNQVINQKENINEYQIQLEKTIESVYNKIEGENND